MTFFIELFSYFSPVFEAYVMPYIGLGLIVYTIYLIQYLIWGKD